MHERPEDLAQEFRAETAGASVPQLRKIAAGYWKRHGDRPDLLTDALAGIWENAGRPEQDHTVRMGAAILLGPAAVTNDRALELLTGVCAEDPDWRVQEGLAKAFDWYCAERGWAASVPVVEEWIGHDRANVRRAAAEGPRVWTRRDHFRDHPGQALGLLGRLRADDSAYVRKSAANAISDISKEHPGLVADTLLGWAAEGDPRAAWVIRNACRHLKKSHPDRSEEIIGRLESEAHP
ncbi:DNA alkylation repair protein [Streptomyces sp. 4N124]|uniref:DNA alkylation repair protein n=1 Tax=Streptomyces sp. 4N124 TaxID=3457420 RepID=UPI003FD51FD0